MTIPETIAVGLAGSFVAGIIVYAISGGSETPGFLASLVFSVLIVYFIRRRRGGGLVDPGVPGVARPLERAHGGEQPLDVVLVVVVHEAGADGAVGVEAEEALELVGVVVAVPDRDLVLGQRGGGLGGGAALDGEHQRRGAVAGAAVDGDAGDRVEARRARRLSSASSWARTASQSMPRV